MNSNQASSISQLAPSFQVEGIAFEVSNLVTQDAHCVGFRRLVVGCLVFDDMNELNEVLGCLPWFSDLCAKLDLMAQRSASRWYREELPALRSYLHGR